MNRDEVKRLIRIITATYPNFKPNDISDTVDIWTMVMSDQDAGQVEAGLKAYIATDTTGFAPSPGQIIGKIRDASKNPLNTMTPLEAWSLVYKAICNSGYHAEEEFDKLPELCQKAIGSPDNLKEMAVMDADTVMSVEQSHFIRAYQDMQKRTEEYEKIPEKVRDVIGMTAQKMLEG